MEGDVNRGVCPNGTDVIVATATVVVDPSVRRGSMENDVLLFAFDAVDIFDAVPSMGDTS